MYAIRNDHGPAPRDPVNPRTLSNGRTNIIVEDPVIENTNCMGNQQPKKRIGGVNGPLLSSDVTKMILKGQKSLTMMMVHSNHQFRLKRSRTISRW